MTEAHVSRRGFLSGTAASAVGAGLALALPSEILSQSSAPQTPAKPPRLNLDMVQEFVRVGHFDLDRAKALLAQEPGLLNAAWDWGGGDWETALGGAGHMGRKDIALFLISSGARMDIFHAAKIGRAHV